jgi:hypothetical protein
MRELGKPLKRVSLIHNTTNNPANGDSDRPMISANGNFVVFESMADDILGPVSPALSGGGVNEIFVRDLVTNETILCSARNGESAPSEDADIDWDSVSPAISDDGLHVVFQSRLDLSGLGNANRQIFRRTVKGTTTELVSLVTGDTGTPVNPFTPVEDDCYNPTISGTGGNNMILFDTMSTNVTLPNLSDASWNVYLVKMPGNTIKQVSTRIDGSLPQSYSRAGSVGIEVDQEGNTVGYYVSMMSFDELASDSTVPPGSIWHIFLRFFKPF